MRTVADNTLPASFSWLVRDCETSDIETSRLESILARIDLEFMGLLLFKLLFIQSDLNLAISSLI